jgi:transposase-like protein
MVDQNGTAGTGVKRRTARGKWTARQRAEIVEASLVKGASINEVAE